MNALQNSRFGCVNVMQQMTFKHFQAWIFSSWNPQKLFLLHQICFSQWFSAARHFSFCRTWPSHILRVCYKSRHQGKAANQVNIGNDQRRQLQMKTPWWVRKYCDLWRYIFWDLLSTSALAPEFGDTWTLNTTSKKTQLKGPLNQPSDIWALTLNRTYRI